MRNNDIMRNNKTGKTNREKGFTLVEILVSVTIFSLVFGAVTGLYVSNIKTQRKYLAAQQLFDEAGYIMNYMSLQLENGLTQNDLNCSSRLCCCFPSNCSPSLSYIKTNHGELNGIGFISQKGECVEFFPAEGNSLFQQVSFPSDPPTLSFGYLTSSNLEVEKFRVNVIRGDEKAPRVTLYLKIKTKTGKSEEQSSIELQTTISKRKI